MIWNMLKATLIVAFLFFVPACAVNETENRVSNEADGELQREAVRLREQALESNRAWDLVESLTTEIGPRLAGTEADKRAVQWARKVLETGGFDRVWLEPIVFPVWQRHKEHARIEGEYAQPLTITALGYSGSTPGEVRAEIIGFDSLEQFKAAAAEDVTGKIVFVNQSMERTRTGSGYSNNIPLRKTAGLLAKEKGAVAVLIRSLGTDSHRFPHTGSSTKIENPIAAAALSVPDADQLARLLDFGKPIQMTLDISVSLTENGSSYNVIAQINGTQEPEKIILIGAHLDSWDLGTGAIDDATGVGITVAAAELLANQPTKPKRSIRVVLFGNEEQGIWGARQYAELHKAELGDYVYASESDFGTGKVWQFNVEDESLLEMAMPVLAPLGIEAGGKPKSGGPDITPLLKAGVPVFRLKQDGSSYFDFHHTADDTLDKVDPEGLKQNLAAWVVVTYLVANRQELIVD